MSASTVTAGVGDNEKSMFLVDLAVLAGLLVITGLLWVSRRHEAADPMEEGFILVLPLRVWHGAIQNRDFDWFYGPLSLWLPAVVYQVAGATLLVERALAASYTFVLAAGLYGIGRRWNVLTGAAMALLSLSVIGVPIALPLNAAVALSVVAVAVLPSSRRTPSTEVAAGLLLALAADLRPDFAVWSILVLAAAWSLGRCRVRAVIAFAAGLAPYAVLVVAAGVHPVVRNLVSDSLEVGAERHLPFPALTSGAGRMFVLAVLVAVAALGLGIRAHRRAGATRADALVLLAVLGAALFPEYFQRADIYHLVVPAAVLLPLAVCAAVEGAAQLRPAKAVPSRRWAACGVLAAVAALGTCVAVQPHAVVGAALDDLGHLRSGGSGYPVTNEGRRWFYATPAEAGAVTGALRTADRLYRPGDDLFVGTRDLRQTPYTDDGLYFLLPQYAEHDHFYDFHPRIALDEQGRLAADVRRADVLVLWAISFDEPNLSSRRGPSTTNQLVAADFHVVYTQDGYSVLTRDGT